MTDSHLPNSHPSVTPNWRPLPFPRTSFLSSISTTPVAGSNGARYAGYVPPDWCGSVGRALAAHGGFCAAVLLSTAQQYCNDQYGKDDALDPVHIHIEYLNPMPQGPFHVAVRQVHAGNSSMTVQAELVPPGTGGGNIYSLALVRLGKLQQTGDNKSIQPDIGPIPNRESDCGRGSDAIYYFANPPTSSVRFYNPNDGDSILWSPKFGGRQSRYQWGKLDDGSLFQLEHILLLVDLVPPIPFNYEENGLLAALKYKMPTVSLSVKFCEKIKDVEWLLTRTRMQRLHNGRFDMDVQVIDDNGSIVATSVQVIAMIPRTEKRKIKAEL